MTSAEVSRLLEACAERIRALGVRRLALFGSVANGTAHPGSDVDFLVDFDGAPTFDRYAALASLLEDALRCDIDLVTMNSLREPRRAQELQEPRDVLAGAWGLGAVGAAHCGTRLRRALACQGDAARRG